MKIPKGLIAALCVFMTVSAVQANVKTFETCYQERAKNIPSVAEKSFLDAYLAYLKVGTKENGDVAIEKMKELAKSQGGKFSIKWAGIFEGSSQLCCGGPQTCTESFGSVSLSKLMPRVEKGYATAINLVLTYEKLANTDGADAETLEDYLKVIREKHFWAFKVFKKFT